MKFDKLVRDRIPEIIARDGKKAVTRTLTDEEYKIYLEKKLDEEVKEFHESKSIEELADILEVISALSDIYGTFFEMLSVRLVKIAERGGFYEKILLEEICEVADKQNEGEWISVEERLPEDMYGKDRKQITVLVSTKSGRVSTSSRVRMMMFNKEKRDYEYTDIFEWSGQIAKKVTHWMPLPEAPKMKGGAE